jgi:hypothetical protein
MFLRLVISKYFHQNMYFLHAPLLSYEGCGGEKPNKLAKIEQIVPGMSARFHWHHDCSSMCGARDTGDDNITSCSRFTVAVVRTATGNKATQSSHAASPIFFCHYIFARLVAQNLLLINSQLDTFRPGRYFQPFFLSIAGGA